MPYPILVKALVKLEDNGFNKGKSRKESYAFESSSTGVIDVHITRWEVKTCDTSRGHMTDNLLHTLAFQAVIHCLNQMVVFVLTQTGKGKFSLTDGLSSVKDISHKKATFDETRALALYGTLKNVFSTSKVRDIQSRYFSSFQVKQAGYKLEFTDLLPLPDKKLDTKVAQTPFGGGVGPSAGGGGPSAGGGGVSAMCWR